MPNRRSSLREMLKDAVHVPTSAVLVGTVKKESPLQIQVMSDAQLLLTETNLYVPRWLKTHNLSVNIHGSDSDGDSLSGTRTMTVYNALKKGDVVYLLSYNDGELYFVVDLVG